MLKMKENSSVRIPEKKIGLFSHEFQKRQTVFDAVRDFYRQKSGRKPPERRQKTLSDTLSGEYENLNTWKQKTYKIGTGYDNQCETF